MFFLGGREISFKKLEIALKKLCIMYNTNIKYSMSCRSKKPDYKKKLSGPITLWSKYKKNISQKVTKKI